MRTHSFTQGSIAPGFTLSQFTTAGLGLVTSVKDHTWGASLLSSMTVSGRISDATDGSDLHYAVGVVNYRAYHDLRRCLESVKAQSKPAKLVLVVDGDPDPPQFEAARSTFPDVMWDPRPNHGFGAGANRIVQRALSEDPEISFVLIRAMREHSDVALASGKLLRPGGLTIDSAGIVMSRNRRPRDRGSDTLNRGLYDRTERVFAVSGAAIMIRSEAVSDISIDGELFDEDFFAYHEDTDLAWRAALLGWFALYVPQAQARHVRGWRRDKRMSVSPRIRQHSFKNHYLQIIKNERPGDFQLNLPVLLLWELLRLGYAVLRDPGVLPAYVLAFRSAPNAWRKRRRIRDRVIGRRDTHVVARGGDHRPRALRDLHFSTWFTDNLGLLSSCAYR